MISGIRNVIWNIRLRGWSYVKQYAGIAAGVSSITCVIGLSIWRTRHNLNKIVASYALEREYGGKPEYLYVNDPVYEERIRQHLSDENTWSPGPFLGRWVGGLRRAVWRRLLYICRNGNYSDRKRALQHLSNIKHLKEWEWTWLSQRLDAQSIVWLAREGNRRALHLTNGVPPLPPSANLLEILSVLSSLAASPELKTTCQCLQNFLQEQSDHHQDVQRLMEQEASGGDNKRIDEDAELLACLETLLHYFNLASKPADRSVQSAEEIFVRLGGLTFINKAAYSSQRQLRIAAARLLLKLCHFPHLLPQFHRAGLLSVLATWVEGEKTDPELCCMAAGALASLQDSDYQNEKKELYGPAVHLLHPIFHSQSSPELDVIFVHGLLGEPFVTWRQRDREDNIDIKNDTPIEENYHNGSEKFEVVLRDIPESSLQDSNSIILAHRDEAQICFDEQLDLSTRTRCWPRDWLPYDCPNIRVLGVSYDTMMTEWSSGCGSVKSTEDRSEVLGAALQKAGVGSRPIVWVAHSMGGLLIKHMLVKSLNSTSEKDKQMAKNTKGIVFFSTPHHGSRAAHALIWPSKEVQDLRKDSKILVSLHKRWLSGGWPSICIGESLPTQLLSFPGLSLHLVPPDSANDNSGSFYTLPLDHLDICKPATRYSFIYRVVVEMVQHAKGESCRQEGCVECQKLIIDSSAVKVQKLLINYYENASKFWNEFLKTLSKMPIEKTDAIIFQKDMDHFNTDDKFDLMDKDKKIKEKDITIDGWWLNIMNF